MAGGPDSTLGTLKVDAFSKCKLCISGLHFGNASQKTSAPRFEMRRISTFLLTSFVTLPNISVACLVYLIGLIRLLNDYAMAKSA
jgi:hypothetical protein